jgi:hypothetical protein
VRIRPSEWALFAYLAAVVVLTVVEELHGWSELHLLASSPDAVADGRVWSLLTSGLVAEGWLAPQVLATAVLGVAAIRLGGARVFWIAAAVAHVVGTLLVYVAIWLVDSAAVPWAAAPSDFAKLAGQADFGISLVWCAAGGVLAGVGWWQGSSLSRPTRLALGILPVAALVVVTAASDGLAVFEHVVAFALAAGVVFVAGRWSSARRLGAAAGSARGRTG